MNNSKTYKKRNHYNPTQLEIASVFHLPLESAAQELNICCSKLKKLCREYGIKQWPFRRIKLAQQSVQRQATRNDHTSCNNMLIKQQQHEEDDEVLPIRSSTVKYHPYARKEVVTSAKMLPSIRLVFADLF